jgi:hypothetical protein
MHEVLVIGGVALLASVLLAVVVIVLCAVALIAIKAARLVREAWRGES